MKKFIVLTLVAAMLIAALSGCALLAAGIIAGEDETTASDSPSGSQSAAKPDPTIDETNAEIEETVLYSDDEYTITVTGIEKDWSDTVLKLLVENRTDRNIALKGNYFVVNGITIPGWMYIEVAAQKKSNGELRLYENAMETAGISQVATLSAYETEILDTDDLFGYTKEMPLTINTSLAGSYEQKINDEGSLIWESNGISITSQVIEDARFVHRVQLFIRNDTDRNINLTADDISVNGFTLSGLLLENVAANSVAFGDLLVGESELEENNITEIEEVTFTIRVNPADDIFTTLAESPELTVTP